MNIKLTAYWIEFGHTLSEQFGVTAYSLDDAKFLLNQKIFEFRKANFPPIKKIIGNFQYKDLDQNHIACNIGPISERGVWFPNMVSC